MRYFVIGLSLALWLAVAGLNREAVKPSAIYLTDQQVIEPQQIEIQAMPADYLCDIRPWDVKKQLDQMQRCQGEI